MKRGDHVVCVSANFSLDIKKFYAALPTEGTSYVIREVIDGGDLNGDPAVAVYLVGLENPRSNRAPFYERGFHEWRFRPLDEMQNRKTDSRPHSEPDEAYRDPVYAPVERELVEK